MGAWFGSIPGAQVSLPVTGIGKTQGSTDEHVMVLDVEDVEAGRTAPANRSLYAASHGALFLFELCPGCVDGLASFWRHFWICEVQRLDRRG